jgi:predicted AAA+ superfamily ATPase
MNIPKEDLISILSQFNPWWRAEKMLSLPAWKRAPFQELFDWTSRPPAPRAIMVSGPRQVGKTTLVLQVIEELLAKGVPAGNILYATFDHPLIKLSGVDNVLAAWREREPKLEGPEYLFLDEAQFIPEWEVWIKHQVDFVIKDQDRRIIFTGSAMSLTNEKNESGVGRWHAIRITTLSFYEYVQLKKLKNLEDKKIRNYFVHKKLNIVEDFPNFEVDFINQRNISQVNIPQVESISQSLGLDWLVNLQELNLPGLAQLKELNDLFKWEPAQFQRTAENAKKYLGHFHEYLIHGGFPQIAKIENIAEAQKLLREDIIEKVLKRDMTALFGVRRILELEQVFLYLCLHGGGLLDIQKLCENLQVKKPTAQSFLNILEACHLIYRLHPYGYGKEILRAKYKVYLADSSLAPAVLLSGKSVIENPEKLSVMIETAVFKHIYIHYYQKSIRFTYWQNKKKEEVDLVAELSESLVPFEIKYRGQHTSKKNLSGLKQFCEENKIKYGYVITKDLEDFGLHPEFNDCKIMRIPAMLLCYWMGQMELLQKKD